MAVAKIALIVEHATSGGRVLPHALDDGRIVEVWEDGQKRQPRETSFSQAVKWLMASAFKPISFTWISKAGPGYRRRKCIYQKEEQQMSELSPRAQKARRESAGKTRHYWAKANAARARAMKPHEARIASLAAAAERKYPELNGRATKAAELVRRGHVARQERSARFSVCSQEGDEIYLVDTERRRCTCYDHKSGNAPRINGAPMCKHRAACLMWLKLQEPNPARIHAEQKRLEALQAGAILI